MGICGIIAEFNPLHNGHKYLIDAAKKNGDLIVCVLSGSFVQRGEPAFISKFDRTKMALECGCDLCIELPCVWSMSSAASFAMGAVGLLKCVGAEKIIFGSECGDINLITKTADILSSHEFSQIMQQELNGENTFAVLRQQAVAKIDKKCSDILSSPNDILSLEYILASRQIGFHPTFCAVTRKGAGHDSFSDGEFVSSSFIRSADDINPAHLPPAAYRHLKDLLEKGQITDYSKLDNMVLSTLRLKSKEDFCNLPDLSEGIENRLYKSVKTAKTLCELYFSVKSKRYTLARIRRLCMNAFLSIPADYVKKPVPYIRPLGFTKQGEEILKLAAKNTDTPILSRIKDISALDDFSKAVFDAEQRATDIFSLCLKEPMDAMLDYTQKIIKQ